MDFSLKSNNPNLKGGEKRSKVFLLLEGKNRSCDGSFSAFSSCPHPPRTTELHLQHGAQLRRLARHSASIRPVVSVVQYGCRLRGHGARIESENPSPRGVVHLGPSSPFIPGAIQFASISGITITGQYRCDPSALSKPGESSDNCLATKNYSSTIFSNAAWNSTHETSGYEQCGYGFCAGSNLHQRRRSRRQYRKPKRQPDHSSQKDHRLST